ncbi:MATE family efflux transporter [Haloplanus aerogenes]|uniref:MATE family efflux transporter n=1 Tax=Haloplanus aerogenes TaxID=660522 RepID=A0A3M0DSJ1_9EURY|nr:MATE family efflux transporter [Haloplanus aerogenes]AZH26214.1 MATE family efflux transporter [Haloplanus aerogenes]RMB18333.1 putative MATE family efflux protein [Haloplanus aerogenes]
MNLSDIFKSREEFDLTSGDVGKPLFYLSLPIVVTNLLQTAYNLADTFWIGQYSTDALAAISFAFPMVFLIISLGMGLAVAGSILVAQHTGAGQDGEAEFAASQTVGFAAVASVLLGAVAYVFVGDALSLLGASPDVLPLATAYMEIISLGIFFMFGFFVFISLMRGYGDTITPMLVMLGSVALNVVLDPFLIFGWWIFPQWGIEGAAIATVFSRGLALAVGLWIMLSGRRGVRIRPHDIVPDLEYGRRLLRIGVPASVEGTGQAVAINLLMFIVGTFSTPVVAAFGIGVRVFSVIFLPAIAVSRGVETMSGQNIGAGKPDRAALTARVAARTTFVVLAVAGVFTFFFADPVVSLFTNDEAVVEVGATFLRYVAPSFGFIGIMRSYNGGFRGAGKTLTAAAIAVSMLGLIRLPIAWVASGFMGPPGIWLSFFISNVVGAVIAYVWFQRGTWRSSGTRPRVDVADDPATD